MKQKTSWRFFLFGFFPTLVLVLVAGGISVPARQGAVTDEAKALSPEQTKRIETANGLLQRNTGAELCVLTVATTGRVKIATYAREVMSAWGLGGEAGKGVLVLVAVKDRTLHIIVGPGLAPVLPDDKVGWVEDKYMIPYFRKGNYGEGILRGVVALAGIIDPAHTSEYQKLLEATPPQEKPTLPSSGELRIKLGQLDQPLTLTAPDLQWKAANSEGRGNRLQLSWDGQCAYLDGKKIALPLLVTAREPLEVNGVAFRGAVQVLNSSPPLVLNLVDLDSYLAGVLNHEIDTRWPAAVVDAQTILARTYALKRKQERAKDLFDLDRTVTDQVYGGVAAEDAGAWDAVKRTQNLVLTYEGSLVSAFYHSCCGGRTEKPSAVWGGADAPYQQSVVCTYCSDAPRYFWRFPEQGQITGGELARLLGLSEEIKDLLILEKTATGRVAKIELLAGEKRLVVTGQDFREWLGFTRLWSTAFQVERDQGFIFRGSGSGHGVGLCQWGARGMAKQGFNVKAILNYYFPGTKVLPLEKLK